VNRPSDDPIARARAAALAELRATPVATSWRRQATIVVAVWLGVSLLGGAATLLTGIAAPRDVLVRTPMLAALLAVAAAAGVAALAPRARPWALLAIAAGALAMIALVVLRGAGVPSASPGWVCSLSHIGIGIVPLAFGLWSLRQSAWTGRRAVAAGLGAGTAGAFLGELACHQGARHVLVHHVGAWLLVALACIAISRRARPRTFAP